MPRDTGIDLTSRGPRSRNPTPRRPDAQRPARAPRAEDDIHEDKTKATRTVAERPSHSSQIISKSPRHSNGRCPRSPPTAFSARMAFLLVSRVQMRPKCRSASLMASRFSAGTGTRRRPGPPRLTERRVGNPESALTWAIHPVVGTKPWRRCTNFWIALYQAGQRRHPLSLDDLLPARYWTFVARPQKANGKGLGELRIIATRKAVLMTVSRSSSFTMVSLSTKVSRSHTAPARAT
jgi:hypothetical protein